MNRNDWFEFECIIQGFIEGPKPKTAADANDLCASMHEHLEAAVYEYFCDDENLDLDDYEAHF